MKLQIPTGLTALLASFEHVLIACHLPERQSLLSPSFLARIEPAHARLTGLAERHAEQKRLWTLALHQRRQHQTSLVRLVRDSWIMLKRRDQREQHSGLLLALFRMPNLAPQHASALEWLEHARNLVAGELRATQAGHAPMAFPSAAELSACLKAATLAEAEYTEHLQALRLLEIELREAQRHATHTLRCLAARLRESQFDERPEQARALLRSFGFRFKSTASDDAAARAELTHAETAVTQPQAGPEAPATTAQATPDAEPAETAPRWSALLRRWGHGLKHGMSQASPGQQPGHSPGLALRHSN